MSLLAALALAATPAPAGSCHAALGPAYEGTELEALPGRVDGTTLAGPAALATLRHERGDATITIVGGSFAGADFRNARLHNICFVDTDLSRSDWRGAVAPGMGFVRLKLAGATFDSARMPHVVLRDVDLENASAAGADWSNGQLAGGALGTFTGFVLDSANLAGFEFACGMTVFDGCPADTPLSLRGADLRGAKLDSLWEGIDVAGARLDRTEVAFEQLASLASATVAGPLVLRGGDAAIEISAADREAIVAATLPPDMDWADRASFDCAAAGTRVERMICAEGAYSLRQLDRELAAVYRRAVAADPSVAASQRAWLAERDRCADSICLERAYAARAGALVGRFGPPAWLRPGVRAYFVSERIAFAEPFRATSLYRRILPAIVGAASSRVAVRANADGTIDAAGEAIGGNAHMCGLSGERLRFDPATGWFSGPFPREADGPRDPSAPPMRVLRLDGDTAEVFRSGHNWGDTDPVEPRFSDYAGCGARAGFETMVRVPASDAEVDALLETLGGA
jgi:uncharacterized protein YjbI with pentapeptide repeats/uncharacterized protein YecT (DUF1311 family)